MTIKTATRAGLCLDSTKPAFSHEVKTIKVGKSQANSAFRLDGQYADVTKRLSGTVSVIDTEWWEVIKTVAVGKRPFGIYLFDPTEERMAGNRYRIIAHNLGAWYFYSRRRNQYLARALEGRRPRWHRIHTI